MTDSQKRFLDEIIDNSHTLKEAHRKLEAFFDRPRHRQGFISVGGYFVKKQHRLDWRLNVIPITRARAMRKRRGW